MKERQFEPVSVLAVEAGDWLAALLEEALRGARCGHVGFLNTCQSERSGDGTCAEDILRAAYAEGRGNLAVGGSMSGYT